MPPVPDEVELILILRKWRRIKNKGISDFKNGVDVDLDALAKLQTNILKVLRLYLLLEKIHQPRLWHSRKAEERGGLIQYQ